MKDFCNFCNKDLSTETFIQFEEDNYDGDLVQYTFCDQQCCDNYFKRSK